MRRAQFLCHFQTRGHDVYGDDGCCSNSPCCHDRRASNCARAEGSETCTRSHIKRIHYGPGSGLNTAAERTEAFERYVTAHLDHVAFIGECVGRKRRLPEKVIVNSLAIAVDCSSAAVQPRAAKGERERLLAMCHPSQATRLTTSAGQECEHHRIARRDFDNIRSYALDDSCTFVAKHDWMRYGVALVTCNHICVAQAGGHDLDQYFVSARGFQSYAFDVKRSAFLADDGGSNLCCVLAHRTFLLSWDSFVTSYPTFHAPVHSQPPA